MPDWTWFDLHLFPIGLAVGFLGTIVGVGGGFFLVPYFMLVYDPERFGPVLAAGTSLAIVLLNGASASYANALRRRIDYRVGFAFAAATLPGAALGPFLLPHVPGATFKMIFAGLLLAAAAYLLFFSSGAATRPLLRGTRRRLVEADGCEWSYEVNFAFGALTSLVIGFVASMFGVGGGVLHMPILVLAFAMPPHVASATSQFVLVFTSAIATVVNAARGDVDLIAFFFAGLGVAFGAQAGVRLSARVSGPWLKRFLAIVLGIVAFQMAAKALGVFGP